MTKNEKIDILAVKTHEICLKVLVSGTYTEATKALEALEAAISLRPDYVTTIGTYTAPPATEDLKHVADDVSDEKVKKLG